MIAFLALRDRPLLRSNVAGSLWLDTPEERAAANLRSALWRVRRCGVDVVRATATHVGLAPEVSVDFRGRSGRAHRLLDRSAVCTPSDAEPLQFVADLLPDWYEGDWLIVEQQRWRQLRLHALEAMADRFVEARRFAAAVEAAQLAVSGDPLRESAYRALIRAYIVEGNYCEALRQFEAYRCTLQDALGLKPSGEIERLIEPLRRR